MSTSTPRRTMRDSLTLADAPGFSGRVLRGIECVGNRLPHPFYLFVILAGIIAVSSAVAAAFGATTTDPATGEQVAIQSILSGDGLVYAATSAIQNFISFPPFGLVLTVMLGIGVAERTGLLNTFMRSAVMAAPKWAVTAVVVVVSMLGHLASDSAVILLPPLAAAAFLAAGRHPLAGFITSYCAVLAAYSANVIPGTNDLLMSGISTSAAQIVDPDAEVSVLANYYFMGTSTIVLAVVITFVCTRFVEPKLAPYTGPGALDPESSTRPTAAERRGLRAAGIALLAFVAVLAVAVAIPGSPLQGENGDIIRSPFMSSLPVFLMLMFLTLGVVYGLVSRALTSWNQVPGMMADAVKDLVPFIVVIFAAAQAIAWFTWSRMGLLIAGGGADAMKASGLDGIWGLLVFSVFVFVPALVLASSSALWSLLAPIFIPMFMLVGIDPAYTQAAYRITDSATNPLVAVNPYLPVILGLMQRYSPKAGFGTLFSLVLPFTLTIWIVWLLQLLVWGLLGLPVGPGHDLHL